MKRLLFICNAHAGRSAVKGHGIAIIDTLIKAGFQVEVHVTQYAGDAARVAAERGGEFDRVVCSGGDGTMDEVINGLMTLPQEKRPPVGYIPAGTTNDYARTLKLSFDMEEAAVVAAEGEGKPVDIGRFDDQYFTYVFGFGLFTEVSYATPQDLKKVLGHQAYIIEGIRSLTEAKPYHMKITWDDKEAEGEFLLGIVSNSISIAGLKGLWGDEIQVDDGTFEITLIREPKNVAEWSKLPMDLINPDGKQELAAERLNLPVRPDLVIRDKASHITFTCQEDVKWVQDGEYAGIRHYVEVDNLHKALKVVRVEKAEEMKSL